jgi:hypothetical protein
MSQAQQQNNQEDEFNSVPSNTWFIQETYDGRVRGKIQFLSTTHLEIVPEKIPEPIGITAEQIADKVSPRQIKLNTTSKKALTTPYEERFSGARYNRRIWIKEVECAINQFTQEEFGEIIWAKEEGTVICCKWSNYYYKGGKEKGHYCTLTYFNEEDPEETIPNWQLYCVGNLIGQGNIEYYDSFCNIAERERRLYRISKIEIPPVETAKEVVKRIKETPTFINNGY